MTQHDPDLLERLKALDRGAFERLACDGLIVPSARYEGRNLIVFTENLDKDCVVEAVESVEFSWPD